ncbi:MAG: DNA replication/repair protein RecF [Salinisphaeraceae bacterium]|nr:DNA replication/repair protein RecF [Salinisphaeraceae bacterium]
MQLLELQVKNLRCLADAQLRPQPGINFILGDNGDGKTSLLEAIHILSRAQSFRGTSQRRLIRDNTEELIVFGRLQLVDQSPFTIGVARRANQLRFKLNGETGIRVLDLVRSLPIQVISPGLHALLERGPSQRRRFMDWGVFHVEQGFYPLWQRYHRALRQRNAALRKKQPWSDIAIWDSEIAQTAEHMHEQRLVHIRQLQAAAGVCLATDEAGFVYNRGWPDDISLDAQLHKNRERDLRAGYTTAGPHRADLNLSWQGRNALESASRGEQKRLISHLLLMQAQIVGEATGRPPLLLVDDMAAELGEQYREDFLQAVDDSGMQAFLSFLEVGQIPAPWRKKTMFHVKQGVIQ